MQFLAENDFYKTSDLALAAVISLSIPLEAIDRAGGQKAQFIFCRTNDLDEIISQYWRGEIRVEPRQFFNAIRDIKTRLYVQ